MSQINEESIPRIAKAIQYAMADGREFVLISEILTGFNLDDVDFSIVDKAIAKAGFRRKCDGDDDTGVTYRAIR